jgi:replicative DNA helicase
MSAVLSGAPSDPRDEVARLRVPPHSIEAEQSVLGGLLLDNNAWDKAGDLLADGDFYRHEHRLIYAAIGGLVAATKPADVLTVYEHLQSLGKADEVGGLAYINDLAQSVPSAANIRRYAEIVRDRAVMRQLVTAADQIATQAFNPQGRSADDVLEFAQSILGAMERRKAAQQPRTVEAVVMQRLAHIEAVADGSEAPGWPTGLPWLDRALNGGLRPGLVYCLAARPGIGKTSLALQLGRRQAADGRPVLVLSQEMPEGELADRLLSSVGHIDYGDLQIGKMSQEQWSRLAEAVDETRKLPMWIDDQPALGMSEIRIKARQVKGLRVLVLDYLQLCQGTADTRNSQIEEITRGLKALAKQLGVAVIVLSQLNRDAAKRAGGEPALANLRDSGAIEQDIDVALMMWRINDRLIGFKVEKNRQGRLGRIGLDFDGAVQRWGESMVDINARPESGPRGYE